MTMCIHPLEFCECLFCVPERPQEKPTCDCAVCASGQAVNIQEWRTTDPRHEQIYQAMIAGVRNGTLQVKGAVS